MANILPPPKGSIIKSDKFFNLSPKVVKVGKKENEYLKKIEKKVIKIDKLLKNSLILSKKENEAKRKVGEQKEFEEKEKDLEKKKPKKVKGLNLPSPPKMGFLDWIKNFIAQTILGFFAVRLIDFLPQLLKILPVIIKVGDFLIDVGGKILDGLITFVDWGYKAIDGTRSFIKQLGGEGLAKNFDKFAGAIDNVIEIAIITALATADSGGAGDLFDLGADFIKDKVLKRGAQQAAAGAAGEAAGTAGGATQAAGIGAGAIAGIIAGAGLLASAVGEAGFQIRKVAIKPIQNLEKDFNKDKNPLTKIGRGIILGMVRPLYGIFSTVGFLLDVVGAPFRYAIELLRYPFLSDKDKVTQAKNLAKFDARIREDLRKALNMITLGFAFKEKGSFGNIYGNKGSQKEMMSKMPGLSGGGQPSTRGGKPVTGITKRSIKKKKTPRTLKATPSKLKPGGSVGGEKKIKELYPESKDKTKMNAFEFLKKSYETFSRSTGLGSLVALAIKPLMGDKPSYADYKNVGVGINNWMNSSVGSGTLAYAGGGEVRMESIISGEDYSDVIAKSVQDSVAPQVDRTIQDLMKQLMLKKEEVEKPKSPGEDPNAMESGEDFGGDATDGIGGARLFMAAGFPMLAAAILSGNVQQESGWKGQRTPWVLNDGAGTNKGLISWNRSRIVNAEKFLGKPLEKASNAEQVRWIKEELRQYGLLKIFLDPKSTEAQLKQASYKYIGWGDLGDRWNYSSKIFAALQKGEKGTYIPGGADTVSMENLGDVKGYKVTRSGSLITSFSQLPPHHTYQRSKDGRGALVQDFTLYKGNKFVDIPVPSPVSGKVTFSGPAGGGGNWVEIQSSDGKVELGHFNKLSVKTGQTVQAFKSVLGLQGYTGNIVPSGPDGTHVHMQAKDSVVANYINTLSKGSASKFHGGIGISPKDGFVLKLHKGEMFKVVDEDSVDLFGRDFIRDIIDIENKSQLISRAPSIIQRLKRISGYEDTDQSLILKMPIISQKVNQISEYTDYEQPQPEIQYIEVPVEVPVPMPIGGGGPTFISGGVNSTENPFEQTLAQV